MPVFRFTARRDEAISERDPIGTTLELVSADSAEQAAAVTGHPIVSVFQPTANPEEIRLAGQDRGAVWWQPLWTDAPEGWRKARPTGSPRQAPRRALSGRRRSAH